MARDGAKRDLERWSAEARLRSVTTFLAKLSDRDNPWLCGYLEDITVSTHSQPQTVTWVLKQRTYIPDVYIAYHELSAELTPL